MSETVDLKFIDGEKFHEHLDRCAHCQEHPFTLCAIGARALRLSVVPVALKPHQHSEAH